MSLNLGNLAKRVGVAAVAIPIVLYALLSGGWYVRLFASVLTVVAAWEWAELSGLRRMKVLYIVTVLSPMALLIALSVGAVRLWFLLSVPLVPVLLLSALLGPWREEGALRRAGAAMLGVCYVSLFALMVPIAQWQAGTADNPGGRLLIAALLMVWFCDTLAYFGGSLLGRHKLAPAVSPNKTWEGAISGLLGAVAGGIVAFYAVGSPVLALWEYAVLGVLTGFFGQVGDLAESMIKRDAGVKDSSAILPGHGGILDRFDSFLFTLPLLWVWLEFRVFLI